MNSVMLGAFEIIFLFARLAPLLSRLIVYFWMYGFLWLY
jgi:hypothetical protein